MEFFKKQIPSLDEEYPKLKLELETEDSLRSPHSKALEDFYVRIKEMPAY